MKENNLFVKAFFLKKLLKSSLSVGKLRDKSETGLCIF